MKERIGPPKSVLCVQRTFLCRPVPETKCRVQGPFPGACRGVQRREGATHLSRTLLRAGGHHHHPRPCPWAVSRIPSAVVADRPRIQRRVGWAYMQGVWLRSFGGHRPLLQEEAPWAGGCSPVAQSSPLEAGTDQVGRSEGSGGSERKEKSQH